ncbi:MarR family transcriptional regulator [Pseudomonas extremaustralis]|jgi:MarR family transcriptional regulator, organic hydroperoxide resistance regulator|uniref:MarR family transcriptional regulator n=1 Tax=Pseudomonas extremaustralis TaxID=359110 RepID=A0A5C5QE53_9PSED|nr:MarR family transcriptional regulator [Pseudomonas extremaustralis]EZI27975.1 MarR family transcriptional regulator [Pseudomonas extremaustralis 14-3 substr. 14-3b]MDB1112758.1 MarR family transcriptional regulator [Pseudomonas extremaustralis]MDF3133714.1 MarR family transcriptional regulator [Pseudomonas extremaustralis]MDG2967374.1 MarR family transcriptional regulator [Pseudomonas extremaustralis]TWS03637.1 MarR family transcriptional regulator [Pseudomonas extremaustralis]
MTDLSSVSLALDDQLCFKLYAASRAVTRAYKPMLDRLGLTYPQYVVMLVLWEWHAAAPAQPTVKALGERLMLDSGTLTPLLKRLEQLALVRRQRSARDEREVHLSLSEAGVHLREHAHGLKTRLLCDSGIDLNQADALRDGLDQLLRQIKGLSSLAPTDPADC